MAAGQNNALTVFHIEIHVIHVILFDPALHNILFLSCPLGKNKEETEYKRNVFC